MAHRLAHALVTLRENINAACPERSKLSDGWIGDAAHASRKSDHNPWVKDGRMGIVTAIDVTHDPAHGVDGKTLSRALTLDPRVKYVIFNKQIWSQKNPSWRPYKGHPHSAHVHVSVSSVKAKYDDTTTWRIA